MEDDDEVLPPMFETTVRIVDPGELAGGYQAWKDRLLARASPVERYWDAFFAEYYGATLDQQLAMARRAIAEAPELSHAYAAEIVTPLTQDLRAARRIDDIEDLLARVAGRSPGLAAASRHFGHYCRLMNALTLADWRDDEDFDLDIESNLMALAHAAGEHQEYFLGAVHALMYHGRTEHVFDACCMAWPRVQAMDDVEPSVRASLRSGAIAVALDDLLDSGGAWDEAAFVERIALFHDPAMQPWWRDVVAQRDPAARRALTRADLLPARVTEASQRAVALLLLQFANALHTRWGWPRARAELARAALAELLAEQAREAQREHLARGRHRSRQPGKHGQHARGHARRHLHAAPRLVPWLASTAADVEGFVLRELIVPEENVRQHHAAALLQAVPLWWQLLAEHDVLTAPALHGLQQGADKLAAMALMFDESSADPALARHIARAYDTAPALPGSADRM